MPDSPTNGQAGAMSHKLDILESFFNFHEIKWNLIISRLTAWNYRKSATAFLKSTVIESEGDYRQVTQIKKISAISGVLCSSLQSIIISLLSSKFNFSTPREGQSTAPSIHFLENALERPFPIARSQNESWCETQFSHENDFNLYQHEPTCTFPPPCMNLQLQHIFEKDGLAQKTSC